MKTCKYVDCIPTGCKYCKIFTGQRNHRPEYETITCNTSDCCRLCCKRENFCWLVLNSMIDCLPEQLKAIVDIFDPVLVNFGLDQSAQG